MRPASSALRTPGAPRARQAACAARRAAVLLAVGWLAAQAAAAQTLETRGYRVTLEPRCAEGEVACEEVGYTGVSRRSGLRIELTGRALHLSCADGVTPCRFVGWEFRNGEHVYRVLEHGELVVTRGGTVLVRQRGRWLH